MPLHEEKSVRIDGGIVVWDGVKSPETITPTDGSPSFKKFTLKIVVNPNSPDLAILDQLGRQCLQECKFKGTLPPGSHWIMKQVGPQEFNGMFPGWWCVNGITYQPPQVFDELGNLLQPMQYGSQIFPGQIVNMLVSAKDYDQKSKGIKAQLEGFQIVASAQAHQIDVGGSSVSVSSAFGGGGPPAQPAPGAAPGYPSPQQPAAHGYGAQQGVQNSPTTLGQGYGAPGQGYSPPEAPAGGGAQPGGYSPPGQGYSPPEAPAGGAFPPASGPAAHAGPPYSPQQNAATAGAPPVTTSPSNQPQYPNQAHNFLPQGR